jgi:hypothetical protein
MNNVETALGVVNLKSDGKSARTKSAEHPRELPPLEVPGSGFHSGNPDFSGRKDTTQTRHKHDFSR